MDTAVRDYIHRILLAILFLILITFRLIYFSQAGAYPGFVNYIEPDDQHYYHKTAVSIADGNLIGHEGPLIRAPGYVYFAGLLYFISGKNTKFVLAVQSLLGVLTGLLIYLIGKNVFNKQAGLYAGLFYAFYLPVLCYESALLMCSLITFLISSGFFLFITALRERKNNLFFLSGLALGWVFICRPNNLLLYIILLIYLFMRKKDYGLKTVYFFVSGFLVFYFLLMIRNFFAGVNPFSITTQGQLVIIAGHVHDSIGVGWFRSKTEMELLSDSTVIYFKNIFSEILAHFPVWLKIQLTKCYAYFFNYEYPQFIDYYVMRETIPFLSIPSVSFGIISPLALFSIGLILKNKENRLSRLTVYYFCGLFLSVVIFYVIARFRQPAVPFFCILSGYGLYELTRRRIWRYKLLYILILTLLICLLNLPGIQKRAADSFYHISVYNRGILYISKNIYDKAIPDLEYAMSVNKNSGHTAFLLGVMYEDQKKFKKALKWLHLALELGNEPNKAELFSYLGRCYAAVSEYDTALEFLKKSLAENPDQIRNILLMADCYIKLDKINEAVSIWKELTGKYPLDFRAFYCLGNYYSRQMDYSSAYAYFNRAYELNPQLSLRKNLIELKNMNK